MALRGKRWSVKGLHGNVYGMVSNRRNLAVTYMWENCRAKATTYSGRIMRDVSVAFLAIFSPSTNACDRA